MDYNQKSTRPVDLVFGEAQSGNLNNKDVPTRDTSRPDQQKNNHTDTWQTGIKA